MRAKPKANRHKYRNLYARGNVIWYQSSVGGRRYRRSLDTDDWNEAAARRDALERERGFGSRSAPRGEMLRFGDVAALYLKKQSERFAPSTLREYEIMLRPEGGIMRHFGTRRMDSIDVQDLRRWWAVEIEKHPSRSRKTGTNYLNAIKGVFKHAMKDLAIIDHDPVKDFREIVREDRMTKRERAKAERDPRRPIEAPEEIDALLEAARDESPEAHLLVLVGLDAGLRYGEAVGLRWAHIIWGHDRDDELRRLQIVESRPRGGASEETKTGTERDVPLSRRLRSALASHYRARFDRRDPDDYVFTRTDATAWRKGPWRRIVKRAGIGRRLYKDLRDTFASHLLTAGIDLKDVQAYLGHKHLTTTLQHYAKYMPSETYRDPMRLAGGEVAPDLLARLPQSYHGRASMELPADLFGDLEPLPVQLLTGSGDPQPVARPPGFEPGT